MTTTEQTLAAIARQHLGIPTLETENSDILDFHDVSVWSVKAALQAAYDAGANSHAALLEALQHLRWMVSLEKNSPNVKRALHKVNEAVADEAVANRKEQRP
jgi:hypothetical protein